MESKTAQEVALIIVAAGKSKRMAGGKKECLPLGQGTVLSQCARAFMDSTSIARVVIVTPQGVAARAQILSALSCDDEVMCWGKEHDLLLVTGGETRQESVFNALKALENNPPKIVLIHDGARPFVKVETIKKVIAATKEYGAAAPVVNSVDTQKVVDSDGAIKEHLDRNSIKSIQTPQGFDFQKILAAHKKAVEKRKIEKKEYTDDTEIWSLVESSPVQTIQGDEGNFKITYKEDYKKAMGLDYGEKDSNDNDTLASQEKDKDLVAASSLTTKSKIRQDPPSKAKDDTEDARGTGDVENIKIKEKTIIMSMPAARIGLGYDIHRLVKRRPLIIGGVRIPFQKGELGHSDGDALLHAITDAILGAAGEGDIGELFPPGDEKWRNANSLGLLRLAWSRVRERGYRLGNIDCVVKLEEPKLSPYRDAIKESISDTLEIDKSKVFIKGKTGEGLGSVGRGRAIEAWAVAQLFGGKSD